MRIQLDPGAYMPDRFPLPDAGAGSGMGGTAYGICISVREMEDMS